MQFRIDNDEVINHVNRLEKMHKSDFPIAVRGTLNSLAFDVKQNTMLKTAKSEFEERRKTFFKANSRVEMAKGWAVNGMESKVGFTSMKKNQAVDDLEQQEKGGKIGGRSFIAMDTARISGNNNRMVSRRNRITTIKNVVKTADSKKKSKGQKFISSVFEAGPGGHVLNDDTLFRVDKITKSSKRLKFKLKAIYSYKKNRSVKVDATHFMEKASKKTAPKGNKFFIEQAERRFRK